MAKEHMKEEGHRKERKHGGRTVKKHEGKHKKHGGKVEGKKPEHRADKRARGGRMTPKEPFSGAGETHGGNKAETEMEPDRASGGRLSASNRNALPASDFALPGHGAGKNGKGHGAYPIDTPGRARAALSRGAANASPAEQATIRRKVHEKYPSIE